jgi:hypothetical protein
MRWQLESACVKRYLKPSNHWISDELPAGVYTLPRLAAAQFGKQK